MDEQVKTARQTRIDTAREGLRRALAQRVKAEERTHAAASNSDDAGRAPGAVAMKRRI